MIGTRLAHYDITAHLGSGGMGDVYQATDSKLARSVAIKLLPEAFARDSERVARFEREARVLASLNHPNIAAIHGLERVDGRTFLVMELVDGETLAERIKRGPVPVDETLGIAKQIAVALESAHEKAIVHRDLKPANIKITPDGNVKVLDFGLAKAMESESRNPAMSQSPTLSLAATNAGVILGTAAYMSPEQAKGRAVDKRTDIFAFGCVLYEMLTGKPAFDGEDISDILGSVLKTEPDWKRLPVNVPPHLLELLQRCLQKDPKKRRRDAGDVLLDLDAAFPPVATAKSNRIAWLGMAVTTIAFAVVAIVHFRELPIPEPAEMRLDIATPSTSRPLQFALSPDGRSMVFVASGDGVHRLWLRRFDKTEAQPIAGTEEAQYPFWSPDGQSIGFFAPGKLKRLDLAGGRPQSLADTSAPRGGTWSAAGTILFAPASGPLFTVSVSGGPSTAVTKLLQGQAGHRFPIFLPDGRRFLFFVSGSPDLQGIYLGSLDGAEPKRLITAESNGAFLNPDRVFFISQEALLTQRIDLQRGELVGKPETVADPVGHDVINLGGFSLSADGRLAYRSGGAERRQLAWFERTGKPAGFAGEPDPNASVAVELSPDGRRVALDRTVQSNRDVWLLDLIRGGLTRLTTDPAVDGYPLWSPDGARIAFESNRKYAFAMYVKPSSGVGSEDLLQQPAVRQWPLDWSQDDRFLLYHDESEKTHADVWALPLTGDDRKPIPVANSRFEERIAQFSPDKRWVAYDTDESGQFQIVVQPFPSATNKWQVSTGGGLSPRWSADGKELYFLSPSGDLMATSIRAQGAGFEASVPVVLFKAKIFLSSNRPQFAVSRDGRFLINQPLDDATAAPITLILNWKPKTQ